jgi:hypothetical protein
MTFVTHRGMDCYVVPCVSRTKTRRLYQTARRYSLLVDRVPDDEGRFTLYFPVLAVGRDKTVAVVDKLLSIP